MMAGHDEIPDLPFGVWRAFVLVEEVGTNTLQREMDRKGNEASIRKRLARFEDRDLRSIWRTLDLIEMTADEVVQYIDSKGQFGFSGDKGTDNENRERRSSKEEVVISGSHAYFLQMLGITEQLLFTLVLDKERAGEQAERILERYERGNLSALRVAAVFVEITARVIVSVLTEMLSERSV